MNVDALYMAEKTAMRKYLPPERIWTRRRDARNYPGGFPIVAAPPCAQWCRLAGLANYNAEEKDMAILAVQQVRRWGGVLEHPKYSKLWRHCNLPVGRTDADEFGGWTLETDQHRFGHAAEKATWLYIVGASPSAVLPLLPPRRPGKPATHFWEGNGPGKAEGGKAARILYPAKFARFLLLIADAVNQTN